MKKQHVLPAPKTYSLLIKALSFENRLDEARDIFAEAKNLQLPRVQDKAEIYEAMIQSYIKSEFNAEATGLFSARFFF